MKFCQMKKPEDIIMILEMYIMLMKKNLKRRMKTSRKKVIHNKINKKNNIMIFGIKIIIKIISNKIKNNNNKNDKMKLIIITLSKI